MEGCLSFLRTFAVYSVNAAVMASAAVDVSSTRTVALAVATISRAAAWPSPAARTAVEPPRRVVLDPGLATVARGNVRQGEAPTLYVHTADAKPPRGTDVQRMVAPATGSNFDLKVVLELLAERGINEVHAEAGATLAGAFIAAGLADEVLLYVAPVLLGDQARPLFGGLGIQAMADRLKLEIVDSRMIGEDHRLLLQPAR